MKVTKFKAALLAVTMGIGLGMNASTMAWDSCTKLFQACGQGNQIACAEAIERC